MKQAKLLTRILLAATMASLPSLTLAADEWVGMVTGSKTGTYIKVGQDIADAAKNYEVDIKVKESGGSLDNIKRMNSKENAAFGIVQSDVLGYMQRSKDASLIKVANRLRMVFPLYNEEVHVFANKSIKSLKDLNSKTVSVGKNGGGSWMTAKNLFGMLDITPSEILFTDKIEAAAAVLDGKLDAMIYVAGKPVTFFEKVGKLAKNPDYAARFKKVHFVPVTDSAVLNEYAVSSIGPSDYPWVKEKVNAVAVKAMMVSYDFSSRHNAYYDLRCDQLGKISKSIYSEIEILKANGRTPKWKEVDLNASLGNWKRDTCSSPTGGNKNKPSTEDALKDALGL